MVTGESQFHQPTKSDGFENEKLFIVNKIDHSDNVNLNVNGDKVHVSDKNLDLVAPELSTGKVMQHHLHVAKGNTFNIQVMGSAKSELDKVLEKRLKVIEEGGLFLKRQFLKWGSWSQN